MRAARYLLIFVAPLTVASASAQSRPDIPERARIRIHVLLRDSSSRESLPLRGTGVAHRVGSDSIAFRLDGTDEVLVAPWAHVKTLELNDGTRRARFGERVGVAALITAVGTTVGWAWWHDCNQPDEEVALSCILVPRRLGTTVRGGAWLGLAVGLPFAIGMRTVERWRPVDRPSAASPFVGYSERSGFMLGASLRF